MMQTAAAWLAGLMVASAFALFLVTGDISGIMAWLVLGGLALGVVAVAIRMGPWRPTSTDPEAEGARARLTWIWRSGYGGNTH